MDSQELTLRDGFAIAALKTLIRAGAEEAADFDYSQMGIKNAMSLADACYKIADAMMIARGASTPTPE